MIVSDPQNASPLINLLNNYKICYYVPSQTFSSLETIHWQQGLSAKKLSLKPPSAATAGLSAQIATTLPPTMVPLISTPCSYYQSFVITKWTFYHFKEIKYFVKMQIMSVHNYSVNVPVEVNPWQEAQGFCSLSTSSGEKFLQWMLCIYLSFDFLDGLKFANVK